ncbi:prenyltransferase/squalene oxidase repeat-containing protein [Halorussus litoreus]|uniref:prenyltransferase/squalene oxidase repeat-containing protein n=1 Tax=Halorussus litoreus TaxID=1710536 RepID=UPI0013003F15|nr:prenyltransferase/squalene oxidase repeat-containing protein [Halorussus litoreus]
MRPNDAKPTVLIDDIVRDFWGKTTTPRSNREHLDETMRWLFRSQDATETGGSAASYNPILGWDAAYPETTGYLIPTLYEYGARFDSPEATRRARRMARWVLATQTPSGGFPRGVAPDSGTPPSVFNTGQILLGLVRAYEETGDDELRDAIGRAGRWLASVQHDEGYWDVYDYKDAVHSYSSRIGWALLAAGDAVGEDAFRDAGVANLSWVASRQRENGWFDDAGFEPGDAPFLHTIAYTVRGLLEGAVRANDEELFAVARESADRLLAVQERDGALRGAYDAAWNGSSYYCLTGNAQAAVIWLRLAELTGDARYRSAAEREVEFLKTVHRIADSDSPPVRGGLAGSRPIWGPYQRLRYPNWAAKFFADALLGLEAGLDRTASARSKQRVTER